MFCFSHGHITKMDVDILDTKLWDRPRRLAPARQELEMGMNAPTQHAHSMCSEKQNLRGEMFFYKSRLPPKRCLSAEQPKASHTTSECECKRAGSLGCFHLLTERKSSEKTCLLLSSHQQPQTPQPSVGLPTSLTFHL